MKSRKRVWTAALCLLSATVITISLKARPAGVQAGNPPTQVSRAMSAQPMARIANASLRAAVVRNAMMLDDDAAPTRVAGSQLGDRTIFPQVEEFTLTPPNPAQGIDQTVLSVRFPEGPATKLVSSVPITLGTQNVILQRSPDNPSLFVAALDFDWQKFAEEQAQRKVAAAQGRMVPVFDGRKFVRTERMQFIEPAQIQQALQLHQAIHFSPQILAGSAQMTVFPDHQLTMVNTAVVADSSRTFDQCLPVGQQGTVGGAWTFNTLMMSIANTSTPQVAENMLLGMLNSWNSAQPINGFQVLPRSSMGTLDSPPGSGTGLLKFWPVDTPSGCGPNGQQACPSLAQAPVRLDAIVNRIDVGANGSPFSPAGELRFIFTVTAELPSDNPPDPGPCSNQGGLNEAFNIILEYRIPSNTFSTRLSWAQVWNGLQDMIPNQFDENYLTSLNNLTSLVVLPNKCLDNNQRPISCISQIRTNEILLAPGSQNPDFWELREFHFSNASGQPVLSEATVAQTPDSRFNTSGQPPCTNVNGNSQQLCNSVVGTLAGYINNIAFNPVFISTAGAAPPVPTNLPSGTAFLGGSALNELSFWNDTGITNNDHDVSRIDFSFNTCNGCHGGETQTSFQHVAFRGPGEASVLSNFLLGAPTQCPLSTENLGENNINGCTESVTDPTGSGNGGPTKFGDIARRVVYLQTVCGDSSCDGGNGNDLLLPFLNKPIGVH